MAEALRDYKEVLRLTRPEDPRWSGRALNVAVAIGSQVGVDRRGAARAAGELLRRALSRTEDARLIAMLRTNLALALMQSEDGPIVLREARELCYGALDYRAPDLDADDWAYTAINLGAVLERLHHVGEGELSEAERWYRAVSERSDLVSPELVSHAHLNLLRLLSDRLQIGRTNADRPPISKQDPMMAEVARLASEVASDDQASRVTRGRAYRTLAIVAREEDDPEAAKIAFRRAIELLTDADLDELHHAAWELATVHVEVDEWESACEAYRLALEAATLLVALPRAATDRRKQAAASGRLWRWAAHAFVMAGHLEEAVLTLEAGRTRELRRQLQLEDPAVELLNAEHPAALEAWRDAHAATGRPEVDVDRAGEAYEQSLREIRALPGFERFAAGPTLEDIRAASADGAPVVYLNAAPSGSSLLRVGASGEIQCRRLETTSSEIIASILFGMPTLDEGSLEGAISYALAAAGDANEMEGSQVPPPVGPALDRLLPWIGKAFAVPLYEMLKDNGDDAVVLVACGPLGGVPLGAAPVSGDGDCLLDSVVIAATPSATAHATALRRAAARNEVFGALVAVADPTADLPFTRTEVGQIAGFFATAELAYGGEATRGWLTERVKGASSLHLACHGYGGMLDSTRNGLVLADGTMSGPELAEAGPTEARVAVASACQTAVIGVGDGGEEAFSLGAAMLAAGAACALASLWPVDDLATAMLMTTFYEELAAGATPVPALAKAQRWLRRLNTAGVAAFLTRYPQLRAIPSRARGSASASGLDTDRPFAHPEYWAGFVALGT
ncbi:MAG: CHAT domain-containing protein [Solirubrobacteraceae bacterium]